MENCDLGSAVRPPCKSVVLPKVLGFMAIVVTILLGACAASCTGPGVTPPVSGPPTNSASTMAPWKPDNPITHQQLSEPEKLRLRATWMKSVAKELGMDRPPKIELIRWTTIDEYNKVWATCLQGKGWNVTANSDGGIEFPPDFPQSQMSAYRYDEFVCRAKYTEDPKYVQPLSKAQLGLLYEYYTQWLIPCLESQGVGISPPPTREKFISDGVTHWDPYTYAVGGPKARFDRLVSTCPRRPANEYLYG